MTIVDVEARTGLTRANIRFYEREGLLRPERQENGYRNYTEDHVETLLKIKLLRKLSVPLEDIRAVQAGTVSLEAVLQRQSWRLEEQARQLDRAKDVCRAICADGAGYGSMDAVKYLNLLDRDPGLETWQRWDRVQDTPHPWRRYFARALDFLIVSMAWMLIWYVALHHFPTSGTGTTVLTTVVGLAVTLLAEPVFLHFWATTPGKWLMGIRIHRWDGARLTYQEGLQRTWDCLLWGVGFYIPLFSLYRLYRSYRQCTNEELPWDEEIQYTHLAPGPWRTAALVCAFPLLLALAIPIGRLTALPPNRGDLTVAEFAENCNYYLGATGRSSRLDSEGRWQEPDDGTVVISMTDAPNVSRPDFQYTVEDGVLTGISYEISGSSSDWLDSYEFPMELAAMAFVGAQKELPALTGDFSRFVLRLDELSESSFLETWYGVDIQWVLEIEGYDAYVSYLIPTEDGVEGTYRIALDMKLT